MSTDHLIAFLIASVVLVVVPGPTVVFVVSRALAQGRSAVLRSVAGNSTGVAVLVLLVAFGLGSLVERSVLVFTLIKLVGAGYLVYLGVRTYRERGRLAEALTASVPRVPGRRLYRQGVVVGLTNPKALVFFAAVLPQFVDRHAGNVPLRMAALGLLFVTLAMVLDGAWGLAAGSARDWFGRSPRRLAVLGGTGGVAMIGLGLGLAVTGRPQR
ncbi:MAG TPA: LysE family translocator [Pseudonocardia sp.]|uniref:LysE family translocator n=1 Tax=Pseudonocardia sp. TaxID=60912 RepID=UPI002F3EEC1E